MTFEHMEVMKEITNLRDDITNMWKASDEEFKDFMKDIVRQLKDLGVIKVKGLQNIFFGNINHILLAITW